MLREKAEKQDTTNGVTVPFTIQRVAILPILLNQMGSIFSSVVIVPLMK